MDGRLRHGRGSRWAQSANRLRLRSRRYFAHVFDVGERAGHALKLQFERGVGLPVGTLGLVEVSGKAARLCCRKRFEVLAHANSLLLKHGQFLFERAREVFLRRGWVACLHRSAKIFPPERREELARLTAAALFRVRRHLVQKRRLCTGRSRGPWEQARLDDDLGLSSPRLRLAVHTRARTGENRGGLRVDPVFLPASSGTRTAVLVERCRDDRVFEFFLDQLLVRRLEAYLGMVTGVGERVGTPRSRDLSARLNWEILK